MGHPKDKGASVSLEPVRAVKLLIRQPAILPGHPYFVWPVGIGLVRHVSPLVLRSSRLIEKSSFHWINQD